MPADLHLSLLGPLEATSTDGPVDLGGRQSRLVLAVLLASAGRPVAADALVDALWGEAPPSSASGTLQSYVSRLRARIGADALVWDGSGYRLAVAAEAVAHLRFEVLADAGRDLLAAGETEAARGRLVEAEALWRGPALGELADVEALRGLAARLDDRRLAAVEDRVAADLERGRHAALTAELGELVGAHPLRERLRGAQALALYRSGRQADALRALADAAAVLREELGIEPGPELRALEAAILAQDPALAGPVPSPVPGPVTAAPAAPALGPAATVGTVGVAAPLVGRDAEWSELGAAWAEAAGDGRIVVVEGEPGIGKTRLAEELRVRAASEGAVAVWGRADEGGAAPALWPWLPPLRALAATGAPVPAPVADLLAGTTSSPTVTQAAEFELREAVADLLAAVAAQQPVVVCIDDLQWADAMSLELLGFLADRLPARVVVVATVRRLDVGRRDGVTEALARVARRPGSRRLLLGGLAAGPTARILDEVAGREIGPAVASAIHVRAEGNPFYAIELVRLRDEEGDLAGEIPASVGEVVRRRLGRLPEDTLVALRAAAVVGRDVRVDLVAGVVGSDLDDVLDALDVAVEQRLLVEDPDVAGGLRFSHALVREVLVEDITSLRRARLHLRVADAMEARGAGIDEAEMLADHLWRASAIGVGARAADALERAADVALRRVAYATAEDLLTKAARLRRTTGAGVEDDRAELATILRLLEVARARRYFQATASVEAFGRAVELAERLDERRTQVDLAFFEFSSYATSSEIARAAEVTARFAAFAADDPDPERRASALGVMAVQLWMEGHLDRSVLLLDEAVALFEEVGEVTDPFPLERMLIDRCFHLFTHAAVGDREIDRVMADFERLAAEVPDPFVAGSIHGFQGTTALFCLEPEAARRAAALGLAADPEGQFAFWHGQVLMQDAIARTHAGDPDLAAYLRGRDVYTTTGGRSALAMFNSLMAVGLLDAGAVDAAAELVAAGRRAHEEHHEMWPLPILLWAEARLAGAGGAPDDDVAAAVEAAAALADRQGSARLARRIRAGGR